MEQLRRPDSFTEELGAWDDWILEHGLPELPAAIAEGECIPVAVWVSDEWGATLHVCRYPPDRDPENLTRMDTEARGFRRAHGGWEEASGRGGIGYTAPAGWTLRIPGISPREAYSFHQGLHPCADGNVSVVDGVAGSDACTVEVQTRAGTVSGQLSSPVGMWIVAYDGDEAATVRVRDDQGVVLWSQGFQP